MTLKDLLAICEVDTNAARMQLQWHIGHVVVNLRACYLKRLVEAPETQAKFRQSVSPFRLLSRVLRTLLVYTEPSAYDAIWQAVAQSSHWRARDLERLQRMTNRSGPLPLPHLPRLVKHKPR